MNPRHRPAALSTCPRGPQSGVYALEWAIIFPVFFILLYACISYGFAFLVRESMQLAAEDGVRAALQYQASRDSRMQKAKKTVEEKLSWLPSSLHPISKSINVDVCRVGAPSICSPELKCGVAMTERCMVRLNFSIPYGSSPLTPSLSMLGMHFFNPSELSASATILVDQGGI